MAMYLHRWPVWLSYPPRSHLQATQSCSILRYPLQNYNVASSLALRKDMPKPSNISLKLPRSSHVVPFEDVGTCYNMYYTHKGTTFELLGMYLKRRPGAYCIYTCCDTYTYIGWTCPRLKRAFKHFPHIIPALRLWAARPPTCSWPFSWDWRPGSRQQSLGMVITIRFLYVSVFMIGLLHTGFNVLATRMCFL